MKVIGITGGTGAGKTTALNVLREYGAEVIDCDALYHELLRTSGEMRDEITARFGDVFTDGTLDRKKLGAVVFGDAAALEELSAITHRHVVRAVRGIVSASRERGLPAVAIDAIALVEAGLTADCDVTVAVTAPAEIRMRRIMRRENISEEYARKRITAQKLDSFYEQNCTYVLVNDFASQEGFELCCRELFNKIFGGDNNG